MINCIAIDDEPLALRQMVSYINKTPFLNLIGEFDSALAALDFIKNNDLCLMFLDINMPDMNGIDFVRTLKIAPKVIFTTAYSEYAVDGFKVDAIDYLLKPISYADFLKAAEKARERIHGINSESNLLKSNDQYLFIKSDYKIFRINLAEIKYIEAQREYLNIYIENQKPVLTLMSMKKMEKFLPSEQFMRIHRSYIVNLDKINVIERFRIIFDDSVYIPVGEKYKAEFQKFLDDNFLL